MSPTVGGGRGSRSLPDVPRMRSITGGSISPSISSNISRSISPKISVATSQHGNI